MEEGFCYDGSGGGVVATFTLVNVSEDLHALLWLHAALINAGHALPGELLVGDGVGACSVLDLWG